MRMESVKVVRKGRVWKDEDLYKGAVGHQISKIRKWQQIRLFT